MDLECQDDSPDFEDPAVDAELSAQYQNAAVDLKDLDVRAREKRKPGPPQTMYRCKGVYYLPPAQPLPTLRSDKDQACIEEHMRDGYGFPSTRYKNGKSKAFSVPITLSADQLKDRIRQLFPKLTVPFQILIVNSARKLEALEPQHCTPRYLRSRGLRGYQGCLIVRDVQPADIKPALPASLDQGSDDDDLPSSPESCKPDVGIKDSSSPDPEPHPTASPVISCVTSSQVGRMRCVATRFRRGQELRQSLLSLVRAHGLKAAYIVTCVGSLTKARLRMADSVTIVTYEGQFEIVSLVGTLSGNEGHLHICISDSTGRVIGGHVLGDLIIHTTAEVIIGECEGVRFEREKDEETGYNELVVHPEKSK